ncbi:MAG: hypothetical protein HC912_04360 [Saprospiraceae bacterium]|nr:hypothetical protein [Saprospiraceae bacterium]
MDLQQTNKKAERTTSVWRYGGFSAFLETLVPVRTFGFFMYICANNPPHRQAENRWQKYVWINN